MGKYRVSRPNQKPSLTDPTKHACYRCLTKACCSKWCSDFFDWLDILRKHHGKLSNDTITFVVKYSRNEKWTMKG
jgi:hypothetical protein